MNKHRGNVLNNEEPLLKYGIIECGSNSQPHQKMRQGVKITELKMTAAAALKDQSVRKER